MPEAAPRPEQPAWRGRTGSAGELGPVEARLRGTPGGGALPTKTSLRWPDRGGPAVRGDDRRC
eukprot:8058089-Lingulodinium_polyedra.AAC.1